MPLKFASPPHTLLALTPLACQKGGELDEVGVFCGRREMGAGQARARPKQEHALAHVPLAGEGRRGEDMGPSCVHIHTHTHKTRVAFRRTDIFLVFGEYPRYPTFAYKSNICERTRKEIQLGERMSESIKHFDRLEAYGSPCHRNVSQSAPTVGIRHVAWRVRRA